MSIHDFYKKNMMLYHQNGNLCLFDEQIDPPEKLERGIFWKIFSVAASDNVMFRLC